MNNARRIISVALVLALASLGLTTAQAQRTAYSRYQQSQIIRRLGDDAARFRTTLSDAMNNGAIDSTRREQNGDVYVTDFFNATAQLRDRFNRRAATTADVQLVLDRATLVNNFLRRNQFGGQVDTDWSTVSGDLTQLASAYGLRWRGYSANTAYGNNGGYNNNNGNYGNNDYGRSGYANSDARLTGTYRLDASRSDDPRTQAQNAVRYVRYSDRQRVLDQLTTRLTPPDALAIQRRGNDVTIASTRAPQINFTADGATRTEQMPSGRTVQTSARFYGDQLTVSTTGDRGNDFNVTFNPLDNGRSLEVTRRISDVNLSQPVTVRSVYTRTDDVARFDVYQGGGYPNSGYPNNNPTTTASGDFIVPDGTTLVATLNQDLSTANTSEGSTFSMTVNQPSEWAGAVIDGHVSNVARSGRISGRSGMTLNFDRITLRDGRAFTFNGFVAGVNSTNGENVRVDNEGTVQDNGSQTTRTEERAAIGTAVGAIIGAIASGGRGAAIGAILGAGAGAGSVYVQGRDDLTLPRG
ncbi:MAG: YMGG-like glycine zipper-containing protein, partial [Pyrinomonadaceae bacterium]